jgi:hypothetical protein
VLVHQMARIFKAQNRRSYISHTEEMIRQPVTTNHAPPRTT